jgi:hypothetical protein
MFQWFQKFTPIQRSEVLSFHALNDWNGLNDWNVWNSLERRFDAIQNSTRRHRQ